MRKTLYAFLAAGTLILGVIGISNYSRADGAGLGVDFGDAVLGGPIKGDAPSASTKEFGGGPAMETDNGFIRVQDAPYHTWLVTAEVREAGGKLIMGNLYFGQLYPETRFPTKAACEAFRASGDPELKDADDGLTVQSKGRFGHDTQVDFFCSVEIVVDDDDEGEE